MLYCIFVLRRNLIYVLPYLPCFSIEHIKKDFDVTKWKRWGRSALIHVSFIRKQSSEIWNQDVATLWNINPSLESKHKPWTRLSAIKRHHAARQHKIKSQLNPHCTLRIIAKVFSFLECLLCEIISYFLVPFSDGNKLWWQRRTYSRLSDMICHW